MYEPERSRRPEPVAFRVPLLEQQSRITIALRLLLVLPHAVFLYILTLVATVAAVIGWVAALFVGRLPTPIYEFLGTWARSTAQVVAYAWLLTGRYPPFIARGDYPADLELQAPRLSRLAVLFRIFLVIPAAVVATAATFGLVLFGFFFWIAALFKGRLPRAAHQATAAVVRYFLRYQAYGWLLTPTYPGGLFGDGSPEAVPVFDTGIDFEPDTATGLGFDTDTGTGLDTGTEAGDAVADPTVLRLAPSAKRLLVAIVVVGALGYVGTSVAAAVFAPTGDAEVRADVMDAYGSLEDALQAFATAVDGCGQAPDPFACLKQQTVVLAGETSRFYDRLAAIDFPTYAERRAASLLAAAAAYRDATQELAATSTFEEFSAVAQRTQVDAQGERVQQAYAATIAALG